MYDVPLPSLPSRVILRCGEDGQALEGKCDQCEYLDVVLVLEDPPEGSGLPGALSGRESSLMIWWAASLSPGAPRAASTSAWVERHVGHHS